MGPFLTKWSWNFFLGKMKYGGMQLTCAFTARAMVTNVPLSPEVTAPTWCFPLVAIIRDRAPMVQRTLLNLLRLLLLGTEHRWCEDPIESAPFIRDRAPMVQRTLLNLLRLLLGTEHRWCEDPIESAPFIRDRAPMVRGPY